MALDFFGVSLSGRILQFTASDGQGPGKIIDLWVGQEESANTNNLGALAYVSEINVKLKMGENAELTLVLTPPFEEALVFLQSDIIRFGTGRLEVVLAYSTGTRTGGGATNMSTLPFSGLLQKPDVVIGNDITITLHALGVGYQMNVVGGVESEAFDSTVSYADAVEKTLKKYVTSDNSANNLKITDLYKYVDEKKKTGDSRDDFFRPPKPNTVGESQMPDAKVVPAVVMKGPRNDWWFVKETVTSFGYDLFIDGNEVFIATKTDWIDKNVGKDIVRKHFLLRGVVDPTRNMFPILSFQSPTTAVWLQPGVGEAIANEADVNKKDQAGIKFTASDKTTPITRGQQGVDPAKTGAAGVDAKGAVAARVMPGDAADKEVQKKVAAHWSDKNMDSGIQGQFTTLGIPGLIPGESVQVSGFEPIDIQKRGNGRNPIFNGVYGVVEVNHKIGVGGWDTAFLGIMGFFPDHFAKATQASNAKVATNQDLPKPETTHKFRMHEIVEVE